MVLGGWDLEGSDTAFGFSSSLRRIERREERGRRRRWQRAVVQGGSSSGLCIVLGILIHFS